MQVYAELAMAENFCMDFALLYGAKAITKNRCSLKRVAVASALGACFAVAFPLMSLGGWAAITVKLAAGAGICLLCGKYRSFKGYLKFAAAFAALTFALGGALIGVFSLAGVAYEQGGGVIVASVPVGIPLFAALCLAIGVKKAAAKMISRRAKTGVHIRIYNGQACVACAAFYDSGNRVYHLGQPVSVLPQKLAEKLTEVEGIKTFTQIHTVSGSRKMPLFTADKVEINDGENCIVLNKVVFGIAGKGVNRLILHPDLAEVQ